MKNTTDNKSGFDDDFIEWVKYTVYHVGVAEHAANPPHPCLYNAANNPNNKIYKGKRNKVVAEPSEGK